jgi:hypothetical protein
VDCRTIFGHKALVTQNSGLTSRYGHHLISQRSEIAELPRSDSQLDVPGNLPAHDTLQRLFSYLTIVLVSKAVDRKSNHTDIRNGSKAEVTAMRRRIRFTPESGHSSARTECPLCAIQDQVRRSIYSIPYSIWPVMLTH